MGLSLSHHSSAATSPLQGHLSSQQQQKKEGPIEKIQQRRRMPLLQRETCKEEKSTKVEERSWLCWCTKPELMGMVQS